MSIELLLKDFDRLEALAKKADESLHIGKTAIQKDYAVAKMLDENIGAVTDISHDLGLYSATEEKVVVKFEVDGREKSCELFVDAKNFHIYNEFDYLIEGHLSEDENDYIFSVYVPEKIENGGNL